MYHDYNSKHPPQQLKQHHFHLERVSALSVLTLHDSQFRHHITALTRQIKVPSSLHRNSLPAAPMASPPNDRESFLSTQLKSATVEEGAECGICQDLLKEPVKLPCDHTFCRECITLWLADKSTCPLDRGVLFESEDDWETDDEGEGPESVEAMIQRLNEGARAIERAIPAIQQAVRKTRRKVEKKFYELWGSSNEGLASQSEIEQAREERKTFQKGAEVLRSGEQDQWKGVYTKFLAKATEDSGREIDSLDDSQLVDALILAEARRAQLLMAITSFTALIKIATALSILVDVPPELQGISAL